MLAALAVWQGGFTFYAAFVVPIGTDILGSKLAQGAISDRVAWRLDLLGLGVLMVWAFDVFRWPARWRRGVWLAQLFAVAFMLAVHVRLGNFFDGEWISGRRAFGAWHSAYLVLATAQWVLSIVSAHLALRAWSRADSGARPA